MPGPSQLKRSILFGRLPPVIHIDGSSDQAAVLRWNFDRFGAEFAAATSDDPSFCVILLLQLLRIYLSSSPSEENWWVALSIPRLSKVLVAMQTNYKRDWSLEKLAGLAGMSRSGFALVFKKMVGVSPMAYLMNWRMQIACELLRARDESLSTIASAVGYGSESAFSVAFSRVVKCRPGAYRGSLLRL